MHLKLHRLVVSNSTMFGNPLVLTLFDRKSANRFQRFRNFTTESMFLLHIKGKLRIARVLITAVPVLFRLSN